MLKFIHSRLVRNPKDRERLEQAFRKVRAIKHDGLLAFGEFWDVAGLLAPRPLLTVNGRHDGLHPTDEVDAAVARLAKIYAAAGAEGRYEHRYGEAGHRFYADIMWPWIEAHREKLQP